MDHQCSALLEAKSCNTLTIKEISTLVTECLNNSNIQIIDCHLESLAVEEIGFLSKQQIVSVKIKDPNEEISIKTFFIKTRKTNYGTFEDCIFKKECIFFRKVMPQLMEKYHGDYWAPICYLVQDNIIILENLKSQDFKMFNDSLKVDQIKASIYTIARYHACSMILEVKLGKSIQDVFPSLSKDNVIINDDENSWKWLKTGINVAEAIAEKLGLNPKYVSEAYDLMFVKILPKKTDRGNVLCHNDLWYRNLMFKEIDGEVKCRLVDFQNISYASLVIDLLQFLHLNIAKNLRSYLEDELINLYHKVLQDHIKKGGLKNEIISLQQIKNLIKDKRVYGFVIAIYNLPVLLMNADMIKEFVKDDETHHKYKYESRVELVLNAMKVDKNYCFRMEESVTELIDYMKGLY